MDVNRIRTSDSDSEEKIITPDYNTGDQPSTDIPYARSDQEPPALASSDENIDSDGSDPSVFDSRSPQSSATTSIPPRGEEWDRTLRHIGLRDFGTELDNAAKAVFPNNKKSRYSRVHVLLISWETQDPKLPVQKETSNLHELLDGIYHYDVQEFQIPDQDSHFEVSKKINSFVEVGNNSCNDLKIVYYAGHSRLSGTKELAWYTLSKNKNSRPSIVMWSGIQRSLEMANSDVLIILDCCSSGVVNVSEGNGITELIGACPYDREANGVGDYSFTTALITELRALSSKPCFSVGELYQLIYIRMQCQPRRGIKNERYPPPVHFVLAQDQHFRRGIKLAIQDPPPPCPNPAEKGCLKRVRFQDPADRPGLEEHKGSPSILGPNKRSCLSQESDSRIESIVKPWIENEETNLDPPLQNTVQNHFEDDNDGQMPQAPLDQNSRTWNQRVFACSKDTPRALFAVRFREDICGKDLSGDLFTEWLRSIPAAVEEVRVEAAFKCSSTLLLISVPLSMSSYILQHPAIFPLGFVKSSIIIPVNNRKNLCVRSTNINCERVPMGGSGKHGEMDAPWEFHEQESQPTTDKEHEDAMELSGKPVELKTATHKSDVTKIDLGIDSHQLDLETPKFEVSGSAMIYVRNILDKFPNADFKLAQRLGEANWQRHVKIRSGNQISKVELEVAGAKSVFHDSSIVCDSSVFHDSGLGSSIPSATCYTPSASSFVSRVGDDDSEYFRAPRTPTEVFEGKPFKCFICGRLIARIKNRVDWKLHVFADIRPYICIMSSCKDALCTFASRNELAEHEINCHSMNSEGPFTNHGLLHRLNPVGQDVLDPISTPEGSFSCPLCWKDLGSSKHTYISHLAKHMESIALATLPPDPEDMSGDEFYFSDQSDETVQEAEENSLHEPAPSLFQSNMSGAAREERNNLYYNNRIVESPILLDNSVDFLESRESPSPTLFKSPWALPPQIMSPAPSSASGYSPSPTYVPDYPYSVENLPYVTTGDRVMRETVGQRKQQRLPGTSASSHESLKLVGCNSLELDNTARNHPLYNNVTPHADGLYHCPWENKPEANCQHKPEKLKCNYDKFVDFHLKPYKCKVPACKELQFASTVCLLRHEREAHAMHGHGDKPFLCTYDGCERGVTGNGFPRYWNLRDHMKRVHSDPGQPRISSLGSPPPSGLPMENKREAGEQDNLYVSKASSSGMISRPREPSLIDRYTEKQKLLMDTVEQLQDAKNADNMTLIRNANDLIEAMVQTTQRILSSKT